MKILAFGEILWDVIDGKEHLGGAPLNFAAHAAQLGCDSSIISVVGKDELGIKALYSLKEYSVDSQFVQISEEKPTGIVEVKLENGQPHYEIIQDVAYDYIDFEKIKPITESSFDAFYFGTLAQRNFLSKNTLYSLLGLYSFKHRFCDLNLREGCFDKESIIASIENCTILKLNDEEVEVITDLIFDSNMEFADFWSHIRNRFPEVEIMIITLGKDGCVSYTENREVVVLSEPCEVKDTIGAGDSFSAAFISSLLSGDDLQMSLQKANKVGAFVASSEGAIPLLTNEFKSSIGF